VKFRILATLVLTMAGCGGSDEGSSGPCEPLNGSFRVTFTTRSGNCGQIPEMIVQSNGGAGDSVPSGCRQDVWTRSADSCRLDYDQTCSIPSTGGTIREVGVSHGSVDGASMTATEQMTVTNSAGAIQCLGTYELSYTRL